MGTVRGTPSGGGLNRPKSVIGTVIDIEMRKEGGIDPIAQNIRRKTVVRMVDDMVARKDGEHEMRVLTTT